MTRLPDFMIIGAMKCATSTLHEQLAAQPGVFMSTPKEPNFFSDDDIFARGMGWYAGLFSAAKPGDLCGESSTHYTKLPIHPSAVERIAEHVPDAKFVYVMRHPLHRLVSAYVHEWSERTITEPIDEAIDKHARLVDYSRYAMQLRPYLERFGTDRVLPVFFEAMCERPQQTLERVCRFIGYEGEPRWSDALGEQNVSSQRMRASPLRDAIVGLPVLRSIRKNLVPQSVRDKVKSLWTMNHRPELSDASRAKLTATFDVDLAQLGLWLGIEGLSCATFKENVLGGPYGWRPEAEDLREAA
ncbi:MAG: sulfotransferase family protein [Phycisphaeraceae bacterium]